MSPFISTVPARHATGNFVIAWLSAWHPCRYRTSFFRRLSLYYPSESHQPLSSVAHVPLHKDVIPSSMYSCLAQLNGPLYFLLPPELCWTWTVENRKLCCHINLEIWLTIFKMARYFQKIRSKSASRFGPGGEAGIQICLNTGSLLPVDSPLSFSTILIYFLVLPSYVLLMHI